MIKSGIVLIGSTICDEVLPVSEPGRLSYVDAQKFVSAEELAGEELTYSVGGMATNVSVNLAKIAGGYPIALCGKIGVDHRAEIVQETLTRHHVNTDLLLIDSQNETSCTEVFHIRMTDGTIERFFRHTLGAMGGFSAPDIPVERLNSYRLAMFGYGLLLPQLDREDKEYGAVLGRILAETQRLGVETALDFVSPDRRNLFKFLRYRRALQYVDILCINEDQACSLTDMDDPQQACRKLVSEYGAGIAVVHCGAMGVNYAFSQAEGLVVQNNFIVPEDEYKGNAGAGDAFSAGFLHGRHRGWSIAESLQFAAAAAAISLGHVSCTGAMKSEAYILNYIAERKR
ncbi:MAG: carbohydrate kinase family protein [Calditrichaeota bacterium]|nr:MAG: carbohydrate kinase family protein [Calditrichota bacterium]